MVTIPLLSCDDIAIKNLPGTSTDLAPATVAKEVNELELVFCRGGLLSVLSSTFFPIHTLITEQNAGAKGANELKVGSDRSANISEKD